MNILWVDSPPSLQTPNERIIRTLITTEWASSPASTAVTAYDETLGGTDVTKTVFPTNEPSESSDTITLSLLRALTAWHNYRIEIQFDAGGGTLEARKLVKCVPAIYVIEKPLIQSASETAPYSLDVSTVKSSPTSPTVTAYDQNQGDKDVTATVINDSTPTPSGDTIPVLVKSLTAGHSYRINVLYIVSTEYFERSFMINCAF